jgi:hypothetical protein
MKRLKRASGFFEKAEKAKKIRGLKIGRAS